jgi:hypothetical protein
MSTISELGAFLAREKAAATSGTPANAAPAHPGRTPALGQTAPTPAINGANSFN